MAWKYNIQIAQKFDRFFWFIASESRATSASLNLTILIIALASLLQKAMNSFLRKCSFRLSTLSVLKQANHTFVWYLPSKKRLSRLQMLLIKPKIFISSCVAIEQT